MKAFFANPISNRRRQANLFPKAHRDRYQAVVEVLESRMLLSGTISVVAALTPGTPGAGPIGGIAMDSSGDIFGTGVNGGSSSVGSVFEIPALGSPVLRGSFIGNGAVANGDQPEGNVIIDSAGDIFGTAESGGPGDDGTVWEVVAGTNVPVVLASFDGIGTDGANPFGGLVMDSSGNLFGTTSDGGANNEGTIFEVPKGSGSETTLVSMSQAVGANPGSQLIMDSSGDLFGTSEAGGPLVADSDFGPGQVFELAKGSASLTILGTFEFSEGETPLTALTMDSSGNLFGNTSAGGEFAGGTLFEITKGSSSITLLASFNDDTSGRIPDSPVLLDSAGDIFGTATNGGTNGSFGGTVYELAKGSSTITDLANFSTAVGTDPEGEIVMDSSGDIFGTAFQAGPNSETTGTVWKFTPTPAGVATQLAFGSVPVGAVAGSTLSPVTVQVEDSDSSVVTSNNSDVTIAIGSNPGGATLGGTLTESAVNGVATFSDLTLSSSGSPYTFTAIDGALTGATSADFAVSPTGSGTPPTTGLVPSFGSVVPTSVIATVKTRDAVTVDLTNSGDTTIHGAYTLEMFVSPDGQIGDATEIVSLNKVLPPLRAGRTLGVHVPLSVFPDVTNGDYNIDAEVSGSLAGSSNVAASVGQVNLADPFIDLTDSISFVGPTSLKPGRRFAASVTVTNNGNVAAKGPLEFGLGDSVNSNGSSSATVATPTRSINLLPGRHAAFRFSTLIPVGFVPDTYFAVATIDPGDTFSESNTGNNFAVTSTALTVLDPFADIMHTFTGPFKDTAGPGKNDNGTITLDILTEDDTDGDVTGTGSNSLGSSFTFTGDITTVGLFTFQTSDSGTGVTSTLTGRVVRGALVGKFVTSQTNKGTFTLSPSA